MSGAAFKVHTALGPGLLEFPGSIALQRAKVEDLSREGAKEAK